MNRIQMVDLKGQYEKIKNEIDEVILDVVGSSAYINGPAVRVFQENLEQYLSVKHVVPCANGTDALQIALMSCGLKPGDEVIVPAFTYVSTAEIIGLLQLKPIMVDVDENTFNVTAEIVEKAITPKTKAVVPVHLFGQSADMEPIMKVAEKYGLYIVEDNAQSIGADYKFSDRTAKKAGTIGDMGTTSFFPSKNLGCFGDGGAIFTNDDEFASKLRSIANHGQTRTYCHDVIGVNSRLDSVQAAILDVKLKYLDEYIAARNKAAKFYDEAFADIGDIQAPAREKNSNHVFHQYTIKVRDGKRANLRSFLAKKGIPSSIYYPVPLYKQKAFKKYVPKAFELPVTEKLSRQVLSLPIHTEMDEELLSNISGIVDDYFS